MDAEKSSGAGLRGFESRPPHQCINLNVTALISQQLLFSAHFPVNMETDSMKRCFVRFVHVVSRSGALLGCLLPSK